MLPFLQNRKGIPCHSQSRSGWPSSPRSNHPCSLALNPGIAPLISTTRRTRNFLPVPRSGIKQRPQQVWPLHRNHRPEVANCDPSAGISPTQPGQEGSKIEGHRNRGRRLHRQRRRRTAQRPCRQLQRHHAGQKTPGPRAWRRSASRRVRSQTPLLARDLQRHTRPHRDVRRRRLPGLRRSRYCPANSSFIHTLNAS